MATPATPSSAGTAAPIPVGGTAGPVTIPAPAAPRPPRTVSAAEKKGTAVKATTGVPRRVKLQVSRVSPWSIAKMAFLLSVAMGIAFVVMVFIVWNVMNNAKLFTMINDQIATLAGPESAAKFDITSLVEQSKVMAGATVIAVVNTVIGTVLATLGSLIYNITSMLVGGVHVTLRDD